tara:strand:+ start:769 stop:909 length:141 start_codon:yes stop_codon:yes gene_type:complete
VPEDTKAKQSKTQNKASEADQQMRKQNSKERRIVADVSLPWFKSKV